MEIFRIDISDKFEADRFSGILKDEKIPHVVVSHHDLAYDGIFQVSLGWGHIEIPLEFKNDANMLYTNYKKSLQEY